MTKNLKPHVIVLRLSAALLILVMLTTSLVTGRFARYTSSASANDSARVAKFSVTATGELLTEELLMGLVPNGTSKETVEIKNDSEVAVEYVIDITNPYENLPLQFYVQLGVSEPLHPVPFVGNLSVGAEVSLVVVTAWEGDNDIQYSGMVDLIQISVIAVQID